MTRMRLFLATIAVVCLIPAVARAAVPYGTPFSLGVGASSAVGDEGMVLGFEGILADSRCPTGVWCFWEGDAAAALWLDIPACPRQEFVLHTYYDYEQSIDLCLVVVHLLDVQPYPHIDGPPIDPLDYVVTVVVEDSGPTNTEPRSWGALKALFR